MCFYTFICVYIFIYVFKYFNYIYIFIYLNNREGKSTYIPEKESYYNFSLNQEQSWYNMICQFPFSLYRKQPKPIYLVSYSAFSLFDDDDIKRALKFIGLFYFCFHSI